MLVPSLYFREDTVSFSGRKQLFNMQMILILLQIIFTWAAARENLTSFYVNKGTNQPAYRCNLISAFVIRFLQSMIYKLASYNVSILLLVSVAEHVCLNLTWAETPKTGLVFSHLCPLIRVLFQKFLSSFQQL